MREKKTNKIEKRSKKESVRSYSMVIIIFDFNPYFFVLSVKIEI